MGQATVQAPTQAPHAPARSPAPAVHAGRLHALDAVRAGAMFAVVLAHCGAAYMLADSPGLTWPYDRYARDAAADALVCLIRPLPVPIFFFVAGFFAAGFMARRGPWPFVRTRLLRIGLPLVLAFVTVLPLVLLVWWWGVVGTNTQLEHWIWHSHIRKLVVNDIVGPAHLWFLRDLLLLSMLYGLCTWAWRLIRRRRHADGAATPLSARAWRAWALVLVAASAALMAARPRVVAGFTNTFVPSGPELGYFGTFFVLGLVFRRHDPLFVRWAGRPWAHLAAAAVLFPPTWWLMHLAMVEDSPPVRAALGACTTAYVWMGLRGSLGLAASAIPHASRTTRWLADSSYWLYLAHLPLVGCMQVLLRWAPLPGIVKMLLTCALTTVLLLTAYRYLVRYRWLGRLLNGARRRTRAPETNGDRQ